MTSADYRATARDRLKDKWPLAIGTALVASILGANSSSGAPTLTFKFGDVDFERYFGNDFFFSGHSNTEFIGSSSIFTIFMIVAYIAAVFGTISFILGGPIKLGLCKFNRNLYMKSESTPASINDLFAHFDIFGKAFLTKLLVTIFIALWTMLLIVPGIIMTYAYWMTFYILEENPNLSPMEAIQMSRKIMEGHKWQLFCLQLSFIGWIILSALSLGIGGIILNPYMQQAEYAFYYNISRTIPTTVKDEINEAQNGN